MNKCIVPERLEELARDHNNFWIGTGISSLGRACNVNRRTLANAMDKESSYDLSLEALKKICKSTGVSADWLLGLSDDKFLVRDK